MTARRVGIEEELLLVDASTGRLRPAAPTILAACGPQLGAGHRGPEGPQVKHEFYLSQVEVATSPHRDLEELRREMRRARTRIAEAGAPSGVVPVAVAGPVLPEAGPGTEAISPGERYAEIARHYGDVARHSLMCALHVHVEVADDAEGVAVIDRVRPWIPVLVAISGNSPYWRGHDSGYHSWRSLIWNMWPTGGPAELFGDAATYHRVVRDLVRRGAALDVAMVNLDVRLSHRYPTVEFRVADVCTDVEDALLVAALARALVSSGVDQWRAGRPPSRWRVDELRSAAWRAARHGLSDTLVSPVSRELGPAGEVLAQLVDLVGPFLATSGDTAVVERVLTALTARGDGAERQRAVFGRTGRLEDVVQDLAARTVPR